MIRTEVTGNALEFTLARTDAVLLFLSFAMGVALLALAGWEITFVALGLSLLGAAFVDAVQRAA